MESDIAEKSEQVEELKQKVNNFCACHSILVLYLYR